MGTFDVEQQAAKRHEGSAKATKEDQGQFKETT
jgi:hypothetical protein